MRNLSKTGLSLSQAQSISNLCFQRANDITAQLSVVNNASKVFDHNGTPYVETRGNKLPENVFELLMEKSELHACQAFLMEHIKLKDKLIRDIKSETFVNQNEPPKPPTLKIFDEVKLVDESWGWNNLSNTEMNDFLNAESFAAHIGQFIHKHGILDSLRQELPKIKTLEFIELKTGEKTPLLVQIHHTQEELLKIHNSLAEQHRTYEQKVNYYKSKVKNLVTEENARIAKENGTNLAEIIAHNAKLQNAYLAELNAHHETEKELKQAFELNRQNKIREAASLRIEVDPIFQKTINKYMQLVND